MPSSSISGRVGRACLDEDQLLAMARGSLWGDARSAAESHLDACPDCAQLLAMAAQSAAGTALPGGAAALSVLPEGTMLSGRYRVDRFLARGGMGEVYRAHDLVLEERVALKTLRASALDDPRAIMRLRAEVKLARRVSHPHACRIHDFASHPLEPGRPLHFLTMEYIEGETLGARLQTSGRMGLEAVEVLARQLIDGLSAAHHVGVLHRDFKSDNVMLRSQPRAGQAFDAVIMDFGLARALNPDSARLTLPEQALLGSAAYMAPEQVEGAELTAAADVYALGVVLFEMLTGRLPFWAGSALPTALARLQKPAPRPSSLNSALHAGWDGLVAGCLERDLARRFRSLDEVRASLAGLSGTAPARARGAERRGGSFKVGLAGFVAGALGAAALGAALGPDPRAPAQARRASPPAASRSEPVPTPWAPAVLGRQVASRADARPLEAPPVAKPLSGAKRGDGARRSRELKAAASTQQRAERELPTRQRPSEDPIEGFFDPPATLRR